MEMKVEVTSRETIKPSSPTPQHLRSFKLSLLDQLMPPIYVSLVLFYNTSRGGAADKKKNIHDKSSERSQVMKQSLSEILTRYYPLARRIKDHLSVDCNDEGADYFEARVNSSMSSILEQPKSELLSHFIPTKSDSGPGGPLLVIQASFFECGGMALGLHTNHTVADAASITTFLKGWAATASGFPDAVVPDFSAASIFRAKDDFPTMSPSVYQRPPRRAVSRRYVFGAAKLTALKAKAASAWVPQPTRVEAVSALIWKCAAAASRSRLSTQRPSVLVFAVNMRARLVPPLPETSFGNIARPMVVHKDEGEMDLPNLVYNIRERKVEVDNNCGVPEICSSIMELGKKQRGAIEVDMYTHTSWCRMPMYEADFGWGMPTWATVGHTEVPNVFVSSGTRDGEGIEVWVRLIEEDMALVENNQEFLAFATLNPSALN